jgi:uncharacterized protein Usg
MNIFRLKKVTIGVYYYMPDHRSLLQEFYWQTMDVVPELYRTHRFLRHWQKEIDAVIKEVYVTHADTTEWRKVDLEV